MINTRLLTQMGLADIYEGVHFRLYSKSHTETLVNKLQYGHQLEALKPRLGARLVHNRHVLICISLWMFAQEGQAQVVGVSV